MAVPSTAARFALRRPDFSHAGNAHLDGGWWPHSSDLAAEVDGLVEAAASAGFRVGRVLFQLDEWTVPPRRMQVAGRQIKVSGYRYQPKHTITLLDESGRVRVELVVVPAGTDGAVAARAMHIAATDQGDDTGIELLSRAQDG